MKTCSYLLIFFGCCAICNAQIKPASFNDLVQTKDTIWLGSNEAAEIADNVLVLQKDIGGWPKNRQPQELTKEDKQQLAFEKGRGVGATIDNGATTREMIFLSKVYKQNKQDKFRSGFLKGLDYLLEAQYESGGWPQFYPLRKGYYTRITYNDDAMAKVLNLLKDIYASDKFFHLNIPQHLRDAAYIAFQKGIDCILKTQYIQDGTLTAWCAQHDENTFLPAKARTYELPSLSGSESAKIVKLLMAIEDPDYKLINAIESAIVWFEKTKIEGLRELRKYDEGGKVIDKKMILDSTAGLLWGRFMELDDNRPFFCDRDGIKKYSLIEIGSERRNGYRWYTNEPEEVLENYPKWKQKVAARKEKQTAIRPRILISTDIGGTDPDDNQSMIHFLMYCDQFKTEGLISSPSYGFGSKQNILEMIDLYEKDLSKLKRHSADYPLPDSLRAVTKQGRQGNAPYAGYSNPTEGSDWIIKCAKKEDVQPLWVLVWGGLEDLAQALHDAPEIESAIKVYWIGGPNKKWSTNSYSYIVQNFPNLWFIEANAAYRGFFSNSNVPDSLKNDNYYDRYIQGAGHLGKSFKGYYDGNIKMGDTPSLLYTMNGDPNNPLADSWGGSFEKFSHSPRVLFDRNTTVADTVLVYSILEYQFDGPEMNIPSDSSCFTMTVHAGVGEQKWAGFYLGEGKYGLRYAPKTSETFTYEISSNIPGLSEQNGQLVVNNIWPGEPTASSYTLGANWYTDSTDPALFDNKWQGAKTVLKWRSDALLDWAKRWKWLQEK